MEIKQSTNRNKIVFMADSADHLSGKAGLSLTITCSKDGGTFNSISPTVTERGNGWYNIALTTSHTDTLGDLAFHITGTGADACDFKVIVVANLEVDTYGLLGTKIPTALTGDPYALLGTKIPTALTGDPYAAINTKVPTALTGDPYAAINTKVPTALSFTGASVQAVVTDKTGFELSAAGILAMWNQLMSAIGIIAGSFGSKLRDWNIGTPMQTGEKVVLAADQTDYNFSWFATANAVAIMQNNIDRMAVNIENLPNSVGNFGIFAQLAGMIDEIPDGFDSYYRFKATALEQGSADISSLPTLTDIEASTVLAMKADVVAIDMSQVISVPYLIGRIVGDTGGSDVDQGNLVATINEDGTVDYVGKQGTTWEGAQILYQNDGVTPIPLTDYSARGQIRKTYKSAVIVGEFVCTIPNPADGKIIFRIEAVDTATILPAAEYVYDIEIYKGVTPIEVTRVLQGKLLVDPEVTREVVNP